MTTPARPRPRPTRFGLGFLGLTVLTLVGCVNYALSLGYGLTFLLAGLWIMLAAQALRAARGVGLTWRPGAPVTAGESATFTAQVSTSGPLTPVQVQAQSTQGGAVTAWAAAQSEGTALVHLPVPARVRGSLGLKDARLNVHDPLGLWRVAVALPLPDPVTVWPAPEVGAPPPPVRPAPGGGGSTRRTRGDEDFAGLRPYQSGDSPRQIAWKQVARTGQLLTRETDAPQGTALHLNWADTTGDPETRLARLAAWVARARHSGAPFALGLPGRTLPAGQGEAHAAAALTLLAGHAPLPEVPAPPRPEKTAPPPLDPARWRFTLLALGVSLLPLLLRQPLWASALTYGVLAYTAGRTRRGWPPLSPVVLAGLVTLGGVLLNAHFGTLLGAGGGAAILGLLLSLKAAETRTVRDARLLSLLGLFMTGTHFFTDQGPLTALHALVATVFLLAAASRWVVPAGAETGRPLRRAARLLGLALPLAAVLFVLFPRPDGPLWQLPLSGGAQTGLANEISAGEFSTLAQSDAVAFRADFKGAVPPPSDRYWRGPVYEAYDGLKWTQVRVTGSAPSMQETGPRWRYALTLEPNGTPWLLALDTPVSVPGGAVLSSAFQAATFRPAGTRTRYALESAPALRGVTEDARRLGMNVYLPPQSPRARALGESWRTLPPEQRVQAGLAFLRQGGFSYTLSPPTLPVQDRVDAFLFGSKRGFCEHYASAFAVLIRAAGLPTRIVGGYLGGQINPDGGYLIVRQRDAHAWTEVWLPEQGWVRVDPTAVIAPARVNANVGTALVQPGAQQAAAPSPLERARLKLDAWQNRWNDLVVGYDGEQQRGLLTRLGLGQVGSAPYLLALLLLVAGAFWPALAFLRRQDRPRDPALRALHDLSVRLRLPRAPGETAGAYLRRAGQARPDLAPALDDLLDAYQRARYSPGDPAQARRDLLAALARVKR